MNHMTDIPDRKSQTGPEEESQPGFRGSTALLVELGDWVAQAAAHVQNTQSEVGANTAGLGGVWRMVQPNTSIRERCLYPQVSDIQRRIAALNGPGESVERRRKVNVQVHVHWGPDQVLFLDPCQQLRTYRMSGWRWFSHMLSSLSSCVVLTLTVGHPVPTTTTTLQHYHK